MSIVVDVVFAFVLTYLSFFFSHLATRSMPVSLD